MQIFSRNQLKRPIFSCFFLLTFFLFPFFLSGQNIKINPRLLIASPIRQKPEILKEFLNGLKGLDLSGLEVNYFFIEDNDDPISLQLVKSFQKEFPKQTTIELTHKMTNCSDFLCDEKQHHWNPELIKRLSQIKNRILEEAREKNYDYVFLIDSDVIVQPCTVKNLIEAKQDIIANIYWTDKSNNQNNLPQVWLSDYFIRHEIRGTADACDETEKAKRQVAFIETLQQPGIYEVGGVEGCVLISQAALKKPISYSFLKNVSFPDENCHFSIRASALGLKLYVDTRQPAFHIYRESDLKNLEIFKEKLSCLEDESKKKRPLVSIITSLYKGEAYIAEFMANIVSQTIFDSCELIIINANSPENEEAIILPYLEKYPNIHYTKLDKVEGIYTVWNQAIKQSQADYITNANVDDLRMKGNLEHFASALNDNPDVDIVYSDFYLSSRPNAKLYMEQNPEAKWADFLLQVPAPEFSPENICYCFTGPQPMWRKSLHDKIGLFSEEFISSGDLDFWSRAIISGINFKRIDDFSGIYYKNPDGLSTKKDSVAKVENDLIGRRYDYFNKNLSNFPKILFKIPVTSHHPNQLYKSLNLYYTNLSGEINYHFFISIDKKNKEMTHPSVLEKLRTYPNLTIYIGPVNSPADLLNQGQDTLPPFDLLCIGSDRLKTIEDNFDNQLAQHVLILSPEYDKVIFFKDEQNHIDLKHPVIGKQYLNDHSPVFSPAYHANGYGEELKNTSKILAKYCDSPTKFFTFEKEEKTSPEYTEEDQKIFKERQSQFFQIDPSKIEKSSPKMWSILICTLNERSQSFQKLHQELTQQIKENHLENEIEILYFLDDRSHAVGYKRNTLLQKSQGKYICFIDDDDSVHENYISLIYNQLKTDPDCLNLIGIMTTNGRNPKVFIHSLQHQTYFETQQAYFRPPNHLNPIRRSIAVQFTFPEINFGEDTDWAMQIANSKLLKKEALIKEPYYFYHFQTNK